MSDTIAATTEAGVIELLKGEFTLDIPNFEKWNPPRKEKSVWVKLDCHWDQDLRVRSLGPSTQLLWVKLVCLMGVQRDSCVSATLVQLQSRVGLRSLECRSSLLKLWKSGLIVLTKKERKKEREREKIAGGDLRESPPTKILNSDLPEELKTQKVLEIIKRRGLTEHGLAHWVGKCPNAAWLVEKLTLLDIEADHHHSHSRKPFVQRLSEYLTKHLEYELERGRPGVYTPEQLKRIEEMEREAQ